jgi:hypothetical protein
MSSTQSTLKPEASQDTSAPPFTWDNPEDRPYLEVLSTSADPKQHYVTPGSTLAAAPGVGKPGLPNNYDYFFVCADLPSEVETAPNDLYSFSNATGHQSSCNVSWHPQGQRGPRLPITQLPFLVCTDTSGISKTRYGDTTVPLPPTERHSDAFCAAWRERSRNNRATIYRMTENRLDAEKAERDKDTNERGYKRGK